MSGSRFFFRGKGEEEFEVQCHFSETLLYEFIITKLEFTLGMVGPPWSPQPPDSPSSLLNPRTVALENKKNHWNGWQLSTFYWYVDLGVTRHVSAAFGEGRSKQFKRKLVTIGVVPWGVLANKEQLVGRNVCPQLYKLWQLLRCRFHNLFA